MGWASHAEKVQHALGLPRIGFDPMTSGVSPVVGPVHVCDWPRAAMHRAGSEGSGSRPVQLVGPMGSEECQGLTPPPSLYPFGYQQSAASGERGSKRTQSSFLTPFSSLSL